MIYFDSAATTLLKPPAVGRAVRDAMKHFASPGRGGHAPAMAAAEAVYACREKAAALFDAAPEQIEEARAEGEKAAEAKAKAELKKLREELKDAKGRTEDIREQLRLATEAAERDRRLAAASRDEGVVRFKLLFAGAQDTVNRMAEELERAPEENRDKLRRAMLALADAIRKAVGE